MLSLQRLSARQQFPGKKATFPIYASRRFIFEISIEAIEATRLPAITPAPCTRASAGRRPLLAVVRSVELGEVVVASPMRVGAAMRAKEGDRCRLALGAARLLIPHTSARAPLTAASLGCPLLGPAPLRSAAVAAPRPESTSLRVV